MPHLRLVELQRPGAYGGSGVRHRVAQQGQFPQRAADGNHAAQQASLPNQQRRETRLEPGGVRFSIWADPVFIGIYQPCRVIPRQGIGKQTQPMGARQGPAFQNNQQAGRRVGRLFKLNAGIAAGRFMRRRDGPRVASRVQQNRCRPGHANALAQQFDAACGQMGGNRRESGDHQHVGNRIRRRRHMRQRSGIGRIQAGKPRRVRFQHGDMRRR